MTKININAVEAFARSKMSADTSGHDFDHAIRVRNVAEVLAQYEGPCEKDVVICAALLHDVPDKKLCDNIEKAIEECKNILKESGATSEQIEHIMDIINKLSFKGAKVLTEMPTIEGKIVQDADRLDAIGYIGVARCFTYSGHVKRPMWTPGEKICLHESEEAYRNTQSSALAHFDEKLLLLKDMMQTNSGRKAAESRHKKLEEFKKNFIDEWYGKDIEEALHN